MKEALNWTKQKPDYACVFLTRDHGNYNLREFAWTHGEPPDDADEDTWFYYLAWTNTDGDEWDDITNCDFSEYLVIDRLPTIDEVHEAEMKEFFESRKNQ